MAATPPQRKPSPHAAPVEPTVDIVALLPNGQVLTAEQAERVRRVARAEHGPDLEQAIVQLGFANEVQIAQSARRATSACPT